MTVIRGAVNGSIYAGYTDLEITVCTCGILFAVPARMLKQRREDGLSFHCPHGHSLSYHETELDRVQRQRDDARRRAGWLASDLEQTTASLRAQKAAATPARNQRDHDRQRIAAGVCPCCQRTFKNLARHMKGQHPDYRPLGEDDE